MSRIMTPHRQIASEPAARPVDTGQPERSRVGRIIGFSVLGAFAIVALLVVAAIFALTALRFGLSSSDVLEPRPLPAVEGAPDADFVMVVEPVSATGEDVERQLLDLGALWLGPDHNIQPGSATHLFNVQTPFDDLTFFEWRDLPSVEGRMPLSDCLGAFGTSGSTTTCSESAGVAATVPSVGLGSSTDQTGSTYDVTVSGLGADAAWAVVDTKSGVTAAAQVVDGMAYMQWPGTTKGSIGVAEPIHVTALDTDFNEVWSQDID